VLAKLLKYGLQLGSCVRSKKDGTILPACAEAAMAKVRETPSWPRSWANGSLF
jgi:hypothetical protein